VGIRVGCSVGWVVSSVGLRVGCSVGWVVSSVWYVTGSIVVSVVVSSSALRRGRPAEIAVWPVDPEGTVPVIRVAADTTDRQSRQSTSVRKMNSIFFMESSLR
jgi:hypothetical protein